MQQDVGAAATICPRPSPIYVGAEANRAAEQSADRNVAVGSHGQYVPTLSTEAARRVNAALIKAPGDLDL